MSMKVNKVSIPLHCRKGSTPLFKHDIAEHQHVEYHADNLMKNSHFSLWNKLLFNFIDKVYPAMINHPVIEKYFTKYTEKVIADSSKI